MTEHAPVRRDHGYHALRVAAVVTETDDTKSFAFDVPDDLGDLFTYRAGQFCTIRLPIGDGDVLRCYSMSSAPASDAAMAVTVKRVPGGLMSNWLNDHVSVGDTLELTRPSGVFCEHEGDGPVVAFCGGSGVTPVFSIIKQVLATTSRSVKVLYANRDSGSVIFAGELNRLQLTFGDRLLVRHHLDSEAGFLDAAAIAAFVGDGADADFYVCGPAPFMDVVETGLAVAGVDHARISIERFVAGGVGVALSDRAAQRAEASDSTRMLTIILKGRRHQFDYTPGDTVLDAARRGGLKPPFSCELGNCASCMAIVREGGARMRTNNALTPDEVADGWVLTCQALPKGGTVVVEYENM
jgi:3-ketosteroid 9alpha-monooxygenase subunit B